MKKSLTVFFQIAIVAIGLAVLAFMLLEPHFEGRNVDATFFEVYFKDPFLAYAYVASISFFIALYQAFKVLGYVRQNRTFSQATLKAVRIIKYSGAILLSFIFGAVAWLFIFNRGEDDIAGGVFMCLLAIVASGLIVSVANRFEKKLQSSAYIKSDLSS
jgi:hypothetical protein